MVMVRGTEKASALPDLEKIQMLVLGLKIPVQQCAHKVVSDSVSFFLGPVIIGRRGYDEVLTIVEDELGKNVFLIVLFGGQYWTEEWPNEIRVLGKISENDNRPFATLGENIQGYAHEVAILSLVINGEERTDRNVRPLMAYVDHIMKDVSVSPCG
jgi:hypothetical protein